jgi:iron complex outermembrane receptor protein
MFKPTRKMLLASTVFSCLCTPVLAQTAATPTAPPNSTIATLNEVVVTARKTAERIEDVPLTIQTYNTHDLSEGGFSGLKDIAQFTPGFVFQTYLSTFDSSPTIRGLAQFDVTSSIANVSTVVNGVYVPRNYSVDIDVGDVSQVDIVKGPQSALYGGNAFAGVIAYSLGQTSAKPFADLSLTDGTAGRFDGKIDVGGSALDGKLQARAYYGTTNYGGTWKNNYPVTSGPEPSVGGYDNQSYGLDLKFKPVDKIEVSASYFHEDRHEDIKPAYEVTSSDAQNKFNCGLGNSLLCGTLSTSPSTYQSAISTRPAGILEPVQPGFTSSTDFFDAQIKAELAPNLNATYLFGHVRSYATEVTSTSDNPVNGFGLSYAALFGAGQFVFAPLTNDQKEGGVSELNSHELRFDYSIGHFKALVGFYYSTIDDLYQFNIWQTADGASIQGDPTHPTDFSAFPFALEGHNQTTDTTAEFFRFAYSFLDDKASAGVELRHSNDSLTYDDTVNKGTYKTSFDNTTPRFTLDYKLQPGSLLYASAAEGVKDGGFNSTNSSFALLPTQQSFQPETNWTYEVGSKNSFWGGRAVINADFFYIDWQKLQIQEQPSNTPAALAGSTAVITVNFGGATSYGFESDGKFAVTHNFDLNYALALINPTFDKGDTSARFIGYCNGVACPANGYIGGNTLPRTSKYQAAGGATYHHSIFGDYQWNIHGDFTYQSEQEVEEMNLAQIQSRVLFNASMGIKGHDWDLSVWGKNIFDKKYVADSFFILTGAGGYAVSLGELATGGVTLNYHY